ncbi:N-acetylmuramoyl-L-alanine amidase [Pediococcus acidilactici]|nr:N-acetylmuramoyl-L-alanine amidase [Pediococcus acidilactici]
MYVIKNTANGRYYRKLGAETHQYVGIENATPFSKWKKAKQKANILHAAISPIGEQINFEVKQHKFYVLKNQNDKGYMNQVSWNASKKEAKMFAEKEAALKEAEEIAIGMAKVGIDIEFGMEEV